jgi:cell division protein FtsW
MRKKFNNIFKGDKVIWMVFFFLCMISIIEVFSASSELTYKTGSWAGPIAYHAFMLLVGTGIVLVVHCTPCRFFKLLIPLLLIISFFTLVWVLAAGHSTNGAQRWVSFLGIQFQPSEIAKATLILTAAQILSVMQAENGADKRAFRWILMVTVPIIGLIVLENLSTAMLISIVILMMMFIGRVPLSQLGKLIGIVCLFIALFVALIMLTGEDIKENKKGQLTEQVERPEKDKGTLENIFHRMGTWKSRIKKFTNDKEVSPKDFDLDKDAQVAHANIAIASSNGIGKGPGNSIERDFLSQAFSDFIFAIIIEEMGLEGGALVVFLYCVLLFRCERIASRCERTFPALLVMGLALMLVTQALFNILVAVGWAPVTGQPLPLISKGGTSTLINCAYIGAILSVSRTAKKKEKKTVNAATESETELIEENEETPDNQVEESNNTIIKEND